MTVQQLKLLKILSGRRKRRRFKKLIGELKR